MGQDLFEIADMDIFFALEDVLNYVIDKDVLRMYLDSLLTFFIMYIRNYLDLDHWNTCQCQLK